MAYAGTPAYPEEVARGAIQGRVVREETGEPLIEATVRVVKRPWRTRTDVDGGFRLEVPAGTYELRVHYDIYQPQRVRNVVVRAGEVVTLNVALRRAPDAVIRIVVEVEPDRSTAAALLVERKRAAAASDAVSAEQIAKSPDSTASDAVKRVVGATVVGGKYLYIRGLGERYTNTLLNGAFLPSSEPDRPAVPLDVFPAALLANLTVAKSFTPDMPGDFAGGSLNINTREFPEKFTLKVEVKGGVNTRSSFREAQGYAGGSDYLGFDDGTRALPSAVPRNRAARLGEGSPPFSRAELETMGESFRNIWQARRMRVGMDHGFAATVGGTRALGDDRDLGYLATVNFGKSYRSRTSEIVNLRVEGQTLVRRESFREEEGKESTLWGGLLNLGLKLGPRHKLTFVTLLSHSASERAQVLTGYSENEGLNVESTRLRFVTQSLLFSMLQGRHKLAGDLLLKWQANYSRTARAEPDTRDILYEEVPGIGFRFRNQPGSGERFFSNLLENGAGGGLDVAVPLRALRLKTGVVGRLARRGFAARRFRFLFDGSDPSVLFLGPEALLSPAHIGPEIRLDERTLAADQYDAEIRSFAAYLMGDVHSLGPVRVVGGARFEYYRQELISGSPFALASDVVRPALRTDADVLPSLGLIWPITGQMNLRASYANTLARPLLREVAPFLFFDFTRRRNVQGNPDLARTRIYNGDLRWEYFPGAGQVLAASAFYKHFSEPIERVIFDAQGNIRFDNAQSARTVGVEIEAGTSLGMLSPALRDLSLNVNLTLADSQVTLSRAQLATQTSRERPMQGQSPYVANVGVSYARADWDAELALLYNVYGPRIAEVGSNFLPDVYERPFHRLDITYAQGLGKGWKLKLLATNILNQPVSLQQGGVTVLRYRPGVNAGVTLRYGY
jgi:hypothetical protein